MKGMDVISQLGTVVRRAGLLAPFRKLTDPKRGEISPEEAAHLLHEVRGMFANMLNGTAEQHLAPLDEVIGQIRSTLKLPELEPGIARAAAKTEEAARGKRNAISSAGGNAFQRDMKGGFSF